MRKKKTKSTNDPITQGNSPTLASIKKVQKKVIRTRKERKTPDSSACEDPWAHAETKPNSRELADEKAV